MAPYAQQLQQMTALRSLQFPELRLVQFDSGGRSALPPYSPLPPPICPAWGLAAGLRHSWLPCSTGKLEALALLLQKLKSEGRRVLILSQMVLMLDILETFLNFHYLTYIRIDENANSEQRQVWESSPRVLCWLSASVLMSSLASCPAPSTLLQGLLPVECPGIA